MKEVKCAWYWKGYCNKGIIGTKCEVKGCVAKTEFVPYPIKEILTKDKCNGEKTKY